MKRITMLFSFVLVAVLAFGQSVNYSPEELEKLQFEREQTRVEAAEPLLDRAPFTNSSIPPGYVQNGFRSGDIGYAWNIFDNNAGIGTGPVTVNLGDGTLSLIQAVDGNMIWMAAGDFAEDTWYVVSNEASAGLYTVDPATGDYTLVGSTGLGSATGLAYDVTTGTMYLSQYAAPNSMLYEIDLATGAVTLVGTITDGIIIGIAADADGNIYGTKLNDNSLYTIDSATGAGTLIGALGVDINFAQDIGYDRDNDILYGTMYAATGGFYEIDTETGAATLIYNFIAEVAGFGIPYTMADDAAPGPVADFTVEAGDMGALEAHLAWTNPALTFDGEPLTELTSVVVERNGEEIHTITNPVIGGDVTYTDETVPDAGVYNYRVFGINAAGEGPKTSISLYVGEDVPAAPLNLILMADGNDGHVSWDAPTEGYNGGYMSGENLTYTVVRMPGQVTVAEDIEATEFLDTTVPGIGNYFYTVTAANLIGVGGTAASNVELLAAEGILMYEVFDYPAGQLPPGWVIDGVPHAWAVNNSSMAGGQAPELRLNWSPAQVGLSRLITYPINVEGYSELRFKFKQMLSNFSAYAGEEMGIDVTYDGGETWDVLWNFDVTENIPAGEYEIYVDVPAGKTVMHLAFRFDGDSYNINQWYLDDMILEPVVDNDLVGVSISGNTTPSEGVETIYTIAVQNAGTATQNDYTVKLMSAAGVELASVPGLPIEFAETIMYELAWTPMEEGPVTIYGYVEFAADEVPGNNQTPHLNVIVQPGDILAVTIGDGEVLTSLPYNFFWHYSLSQTLYFPDEIGLGGGVITGIQYTNNFNATQPQRHIQIWMGEPDVDDLTAGWVDPASLQLVFDGMVDFPEGINDIFIPLDDIYVYGGGNLLIYSYKQDDVWASGRNFYNTLDAGSGRSRAANRDNNPFDPANPDVAGAINHNHPNITMFFSTAGLGALEGTVTENGAGLEGVNVHIAGTNSNATTNEDGFFEFPFVLPGTYDLHFTKFGYYDAMLEDVVVEEEETTVVTAQMEAFPTVTVMGTVVGSDLPEVGIEGAAITLVGYDNYAAETDADGMFVIEGVYADNDYNLTVSAAGYTAYNAVVEVGAVDVDLGTITVMEIAFPPAMVVAVETDDGAHVSWDAPGGGVLVELYQHDGEIPGNPNGFFQTDTEVFGTIFDLSEYPDAAISFMDFHHLDWGIPSGNYDYLVHIVDWANFDILQTVGPLTTEVNDDWELEVPLGHYSVAGINEVGILIQPQGYLPADAYPVITTDATGPNGLSIRAPVNDLPAFAINGPTVGDFFITLWITTSYAKEGIVKAEGLTSNNLETVQTRTGEATPSASASLTQMASAQQLGNKVLEDYSVYRLLSGHEGNTDEWDALVDGLVQTEYLDTGWEDLMQGLYRYAVVANYTNDNPSAPAFSNILPKDMTVPFTVNVSTNSGDLPTGAMVHLINMDHPQYEYEAVVPPTGMVDFLAVWRGFYAMTIELEGFDIYYVEDIDITEAASYDALLIETIVAPYALNVETFGLPLGDALLTWNTAEEVEFRYDDGEVDGQLGVTGGGTFNDVLGAVHHRNAELWEVSWFLTNEGGPHPAVKVWILGLDANGLPDRNNVLYTAENVPNTDMQWNTHELSAPVLAPEGFFIGVSAMGFIGLAFDDGVGDPWPFIPDTQFAIIDITNPANDWLELGGIGFPNNFLLRGYGLDFGDVDKGRGSRIAKRENATDGSDLFTAIPVATSFESGNPEYASAGSDFNRAFLGFNVFLDGTEVASEITATEYMFTGLEDGMYEAGVQSVYTTGSSEIVTTDFFIGEVLHPVTFNVDMTGVEGFDPEEHTVYLTGTFTGWAEPGTEGSIVMTQAAGPGDLLFYENFDSYADFTTDLSPWITLQLTEGDTWGSGDWDFPGEGEEWAWMAFNPAETTPPALPANPAIDGDKYAIAIQYMDLNDDKWLISPEVTLDEASTLSFWARSYTAIYGLERIRVLVSTSGADPDDFVPISTEPFIQVPVDWTEYSFDLSDYANETIRFAINYVSFDAFIFMLDAISIEGAPDASKESLHYSVTVMIPEGNHEYKYFSDAFGEGWDGGEWDGDPNREIAVTGPMEVFDVWGIIDPDAPEPIEALPYFEDFTGIANGDLPEHWQRTHNNWGAWNSNNAGGESAPELRFNWTPSATAVFRAISPLIDGKDVDAIDLSFWHMVNDYSGNYTLKVQTSIDGGDTWTTQWEHFVAAAKDVPTNRDTSFERDIPSTHMTLGLEGVAGEEFHIAFVYDGNSFNINQWYIDDILVEESVFTASLPFSEDFSGLANGDMPEHWDRTHTNWGAWNSNNAGGESAPELRFNWTPSATAVFRAITPKINASMVDELFLTFMHSVNDYSGGYTLKVQTSLDGETWEDQWVLDIAAKSNPPADREAGSKADVPPTEVLIDLGDLAGEKFHIAFVYDGNSFNINQWYIDDIFVNDESEIVLYTVTFDVIDEDGFPIDNAVIVLGPFENEPGDYVFHGVPEGMHEFSVTALCFHQHSGEVMVDHDVEHEIVLELNILAGDANGDGTVNLLDVIMIANYFAGNVAGNFCFHNADVNGDGIINILDVLGTINIFAGGKTAPHVGLLSYPVNMFLAADGISIDSDGTIAGIEFEITNAAGIELKLDLGGYEMIQVNEDGTLRAMIFSMDNTPFPAGKISLVSFSNEVNAGWNSAVAGNLNAIEVPVVLHNDEVTSITDTEDISFNAYPNPASDVLYVEFNNTSQARLSLINVHGQVVQTQLVNELGSQQVSFDLGNLNSGIYMLRLDVNDSFIIERIMVK